MFSIGKFKKQKLRQIKEGKKNKKSIGQESERIQIKYLKHTFNFLRLYSIQI